MSIFFTHPTFFETFHNSEVLLARSVLFLVFSAKEKFEIEEWLEVYLVIEEDGTEVRSCCINMSETIFHPLPGWRWRIFLHSRWQHSLHASLQGGHLVAPGSRLHVSIHFSTKKLLFNHSLCSQYSTKGSYRTFVLFLESLFKQFWCILRRIRDLPSSHHTDEIQVWSRKYLEFKTLQFPSMKIYFILECMYQIYTNADQNFANLQKSIKSLEYFIKKKV